MSKEHEWGEIVTNITVASSHKGGVLVAWGASHRDKDGNLISRQISIEPPDAPMCLKMSCVWRYIKDSLFYALLVNYHARRVAYAEANRHTQILERYRTGEPSPATIWQAIHANIKLTCPLCRKYNKDPLLFRRTV